MKNILLLALLLLTTTAAFAQNTIVTAGKILDNSGSLLASGLMCMTPSGSSSETCLSVTNGSISSATVLSGTYSIVIKNTTETLSYLSIPSVAVSGIVFNFDTYVVPGTSTISGLGTPRIACYTGAMYTQTDSIGNVWSCININGINTWNGIVTPASTATLGSNTFSTGSTNAFDIITAKSSLAIGSTIVLKDGSIAVNPESSYFGAKGDGVTDDANSLRNADAYAASLGVALYLPHSYLIKSPIFPSVPWLGVKGTTEIIVSPSFVYGSSMAANQGAIINPHFSATYSDSTADALSFDGITFVNNGPLTSGSQRETLMVSNVKSLSITNCSFTSSGSVTVTDLDIWGPTRNGLIRGNSFVQSTGATTGGNIWVLGLGATSADYTKNIHITDNTFVHASGDEAIAINAFGYAPTTDIWIDHFTLTETGADSVALTVTGNGNASYPSRTLSNVHVSDFVLNVGAATKNFGLRVGTAGEPAGSTYNITVERGTFNVATSQTMTAALYNPTGVNVVASDNVFNMTGSGTVNYAITGGSGSLATMIASRNRINDTFGASINNVARAENNYISSTAGKGIMCAALAVGNTINTTGPAVACDVTGNYEVRDNTITIASGASSYTSAIYAYSYNTPSYITFLMDGNTFNLSNSTHYVYNSPVTQYSEMRHNIIAGTGLTVGVQLAAVEGNTWYGQRDDYATATSDLPSALVPKLPAGYILKNSSPYATYGSIGWQLVTPSSSTWRSITSLSPYADTSSGFVLLTCGSSSSSPQYGICLDVQRPSDFTSVLRATNTYLVRTHSNVLDDGSGTMTSISVVTDKFRGTTTATCSIGPGAGTAENGATCSCATNHTCTSQSGTFTVVTGSSVTTGAGTVVITVTTLGTATTHYNSCEVESYNTNGVSTVAYTSDTSTGFQRLLFGSSGPAVSTTYTVKYHCSGGY